MIDLSSETIISFADAAKRIPSFRPGKKTNISTLFRWARVGCHGIKLESARLGGRTITSVEALQRFSDALSRDRDEAKPAPVRAVAPLGRRASRGRPGASRVLTIHPPPRPDPIPNESRPRPRTGPDRRGPPSPHVLIEGALRVDHNQPEPEASIDPMTALANKLRDTTHLIVTSLRDESAGPDVIRSLVDEAWQEALSDKPTEVLMEPIRRLAAAPDLIAAGCRAAFPAFYRVDLEMFLDDWRRQDLGGLSEAVREAVGLGLGCFLIPKQPRLLLQQAARLAAIEDHRRIPPAQRHLLVGRLMDRIVDALHEAPSASILKHFEGGANILVIGGGSLFQDGYFLEALRQLDADDPEVRAAIFDTMRISALHDLTFGESSKSSA